MANRYVAPDLDARREYRRLWIKKRRASDPTYGKEDRHKSDQKKWKMLAEMKLSRGCMDCGYNTSSVALDFDHVRGKKLFSISKAVSSVSVERLLQEIEKCDVVCANCHRIRTFERKDHLNVSA